MKNEDGKNVSFLSNSMIQNKCKSEEVVWTWEQQNHIPNEVTDESSTLSFVFSQDLSIVNGKRAAASVITIRISQALLCQHIPVTISLSSTVQTRQVAPSKTSRSYINDVY